MLARSRSIQRMGATSPDAALVPRPTRGHAETTGTGATVAGSRPLRLTRYMQVQTEENPGSSMATSFEEATSSATPHATSFGPGSVVQSGSNALSGSFVPRSSASSPVQQPTRHVQPQPTVVSRVTTRLQKGIKNPKIRTDGTVPYGMLCIAGEPTNLEVALGDPKWKNAMDEEYSALMRNKAWHLVPEQRGKNIIDCKWVYRIKKGRMAQLIGIRHV